MSRYARLFIFLLFWTFGASVNGITLICMKCEVHANIYTIAVLVNNIYSKIGNSVIFDVLLNTRRYTQYTKVDEQKKKWKRLKLCWSRHSKL